MQWARHFARENVHRLMADMVDRVEVACERSLVLTLKSLGNARKESERFSRMSTLLDKCDVMHLLLHQDIQDCFPFPMTAELPLLRMTG